MQYCACPNPQHNRTRPRPQSSNASIRLCSFVVDSADMASLESAKTELLSLLERPELAGIPTLILCNKSDLPDALKVEQMIERL